MLTSAPRVLCICHFMPHRFDGNRCFNIISIASVKWSVMKANKKRGTARVRDDALRAERCCESPWRIISLVSGSRHRDLSFNVCFTSGCLYRSLKELRYQSDPCHLYLDSNAPLILSTPVKYDLSRESLPLNIAFSSSIRQRYPANRSALLITRNYLLRDLRRGDYEI